MEARSPFDMAPDHAASRQIKTPKPGSFRIFSNLHSMLFLSLLVAAAWSLRLQCASVRIKETLVADSSRTMACQLHKL